MSEDVTIHISDAIDILRELPRGKVRDSLRIRILYTPAGPCRVCGGFIKHDEKRCTFYSTAVAQNDVLFKHTQFAADCPDLNPKERTR